MSLWEGARRLPYYFSYPQEMLFPMSGDTYVEQFVLCPQCSLEHVGEEKLTAHYTTLRSVMCARCAILMGPINKAEMEADSE
jgi:hypothetical protein